jgi:hypothetical protein
MVAKPFPDVAEHVVAVMASDQDGTLPPIVIREAPSPQSRIDEFFSSAKPTKSLTNERSGGKNDWSSILSLSIPDAEMKMLRALAQLQEDEPATYASQLLRTAAGDRLREALGGAMCLSCIHDGACGAARAKGTWPSIPS